MALHRSPAVVLLLLLIPAIFGLLALPCKADNVLYPGDILYTNQQLSWGNYVLVMQSDCNLVLYDLGSPIWTSGTYKLDTNCYATVQRDGNLVVYSGSANVLWETNTHFDQGNYVLVLQRDRNVVIYGPGRWNSRTNIRLTGNFSASTTAEYNEGNNITMVVNQ